MNRSASNLGGGATVASGAKPSTFPNHSRPNRTLACARCRQRKLKCTRNFPCSNCVQAQISCVPTMPVVRRPRRPVPERALQNRIQKYEALLRQNNIPFGDEDTETGLVTRSSDDSDIEISRPASTSEQPDDVHTRALRRALRQVVRSSDAGSDRSSGDDDSATPNHPWEGQDASNGSIFLRSGKSIVDITTLEPQPVHIIRLWQVYLDNVDPLLKITHNATLQTQLIELAGKMKTTPIELTALAFGIYCVAIRSLPDHECQSLFASSKSQLLAIYQYGCEQALLSCRYLQSYSRECLSAYLLYLLSLGAGTDPRSISTLTGAAMRIAERMRMHKESAAASVSPLESELRRRLWWALFLFDTRMTALSGMRDSMVTKASWDCAIPLNIHDADLSPETRSSPRSLKAATETIFVVTSCEQGMFMKCFGDGERQSSARASPSVRSNKITAAPEKADVSEFERMMNERYLQHCDLDITLQAITVWNSRGFFAKRAMFRSLAALPSQTNTDANALDAAITMLVCDTNIMALRSAAGFAWYFEYYVPFPAYIAIVMHIKEQPLGTETERAWTALADNYQARFSGNTEDTKPIRRVCDKAILQAWKARDAALLIEGVRVPPPRVIQSIQSNCIDGTADMHNVDTAQLETADYLDWMNPDQEVFHGGSQMHHDATVSDDLTWLYGNYADHGYHQVDTSYSKG